MAGWVSRTKYSDCVSDIFQISGSRDTVGCHLFVLWPIQTWNAFFTVPRTPMHLHGWENDWFSDVYQPKRNGWRMTKTIHRFSQQLSETFVLLIAWCVCVCVCDVWSIKCSCIPTTIEYIKCKGPLSGNFLRNTLRFRTDKNAMTHSTWKNRRFAVKSVKRISFHTVSYGLGAWRIQVDLHVDRLYQQNGMMKCNWKGFFGMFRKIKRTLRQRFKFEWLNISCT